ncbi:DUF6197 family protein [Streptomyces violascens]|uniref:Uncharacterized protein n=1 Tax=Streptomyces violascens TaxID=67381 RepID=A0ABQ3QVI2_9ACTN|nr:DUF6197 family protein [Streptomyces violascens]GGU26570.1 hypothetical protein GCM10010289_54870 [Streptomyces violascens]GHI41224.1 hypothetical protein Sviol_56320 [Streptomyces violascens]
MPRVRYSPESALITRDPIAILQWAACHIEEVGLHQGREVFAGAGRTVTLACSPRGAIDVAAGDGRRSGDRYYDTDAIRRGRARALRIFAEHLAGHPLEGGDPRDAEDLHCGVIDQWSNAPGRTAAEAAQALRTAADPTEPIF